jgi:hypothetical protein
LSQRNYRAKLASEAPTPRFFRPFWSGAGAFFARPASRDGALLRTGRRVRAAFAFSRRKNNAPPAVAATRNFFYFFRLG